MNPTVGRIVHYTLSATDAELISRRRTTGAHIAALMKQDPPAWPAGAQAHIGNPVKEGGVVAMIVVANWGGSINGQCILDGCDTLWVTSVAEGESPGCWSWPPRVP